ncbi:MAG: DUF4915 domain-containing protein [Lachnospiraceae bacterium]|nr:DUF4915 domain-containing protein [Lachnospiraceae bacterium]
MQTACNTIGIYQLPELERVDEIVFDDKTEDILHINDLWFQENQMYLSMFSLNGKWRDKPIDSGVIIKIQMDDLSKREIVFEKQKTPHSIRILDGNIVYCNSADLQLIENGQPVFNAMGYLRGVEKVEDTYFIGQSESRNVDKVRQNKLNISIDAGIHAFKRKEKISRFFGLPATEIYEILDCTKDHLCPEDNREEVRHSYFQLYIDMGNGYSEEESIRNFSVVGNNKLEIDVSKYSDIQELRFDPCDDPCIITIREAKIRTSQGYETIVFSRSSAQIVKENEYCFAKEDPQMVFSVVDKYVQSVMIEYEMELDKQAIINFLIE